MTDPIFSAQLSGSFDAQYAQAAPEAQHNPAAAGPAEHRQIVDVVPLPGRGVVLELRVRNHPGVMSHITGLFARRAFNLEAILCVPEGDRTLSRILLLVVEEPQLEQMERQLAKLHDVLEVRHRGDLDARYFAGIRW